VPKILVMDDDIEIREMLTDVLHWEGYDVVNAEDGCQGLKTFRSQQPDLVITDILMPNVDGIEAIIQMRRERPDVKIIAMSGGGQTGEFDGLLCATKFGASNVIAKPFRASALLESVHKCVGVAR
jgi:CheY-like chemotaxis protein